jgi:transcriptional regulator with XRE-family HTH domain
VASLSAKFGKVLREARTAQGLSQEKLAELSDLDRTFISMIERGKRKPTLDTAHRLSGALGMKLSALIALAERRRA